MGVVLCATNLYTGLKVGITGGGSLMAAALAYALLARSRQLSANEINLAQTLATGAGAMASAAGLTTAIPALQTLGHQYSWAQLLGWALAVCGFGACVAAALRVRMLSDPSLPFPTGTATASTIQSMCASGSAGRGIQLLVRSALLAAVLVVVAQVPAVKGWTAGMQAWPWFVGLPAAYLLATLLSPMNVGVGGLVGVRIGASLLLGALLAWAVLGPTAQAQGWIEADKVGTWLLWPGVALLVGEALTKLAFMLPVFRRAFASEALESADDSSDDLRADAIPRSWWVVGLATSALLTCLGALWVFGVPVHLTAVAFALSSVMAIAAMRATGETDTSPNGPLAKVTQLAFGALAPGQVATNLAAAGVTMAGTAQACDMMQDLKTGQILGTSPRRQFVVQLLGSALGALLCVPMYLLLTRGLTIGSPELPAPAARSWSAVAAVASQGLAGLPLHAGTAIALGLAVGAALALTSLQSKWRRYAPSGMALGMAFILPPQMSAAIFIGACAFAWQQRRGVSAEDAGTVAAGLIAGEACTGVAVAGVLALAAWFGARG